jgi:hypothetical protein
MRGSSPHMRAAQIADFLAAAGSLCEDARFGEALPLLAAFRETELFAVGEPVEFVIDGGAQNLLAQVALPVG